MKKTITIMIAALLILAIAGFSYVIISKAADRETDRALEAFKPQETQETQAASGTVPETAQSPEPTDAAPTPETINKEDIPVNFDELRAVNPDIYAYISIPDTAIDFPVLQRADDNTYYLNRDYTGQTSNRGSIFSENYNSTDFSDYMTVLYGHTMKSGTMFAPLLQYMDETYFEAHRTIYIYTENAVREYTVFAAYKWDTRHLLLNFDFSKENFRIAYLAYVYGMRSMSANIADDVEVTGEDRMLTLSCCADSGTKRFLVQGVLTSERFTAE